MYKQPVKTKAVSGQSKSPWLALLAIVLGTMMVSLDGTIVSVTNPVIASKLHASQGQLQWISDGYLLTLGAFMIFAAKFGDKFGRKLAFLTGALGFAAASLAIGMSNSADFIIIFRTIQGIFGALIMTNSMALIRTVMPPEKFATGIGIYSTVSGLSVAGGPILGGLIVGFFDWQWAFFINVVLGAVCIALGMSLINKTPGKKDVQFDIGGLVLMGGFFLSLTYALIEGPAVGFENKVIIGCIVLAAILGIAFILVERKVKDPCVPLELFANRSIAAGIVMTVLFMFSLQGALFFIMLLLQSVQGIDPLKAGVCILPLGISILVSASLSGPIIQKLRPKLALIIGMLFMAAGFSIALLIQADGPYVILALALTVLGLGLGLVIPASTATVVGNASVDRAGSASGLQNSAQQIGGLLGIAIIGAVMASKTTASFFSELVNAKLPQELISSLSGAAQVTQSVTLGIAPIPANASYQIGEVIRHATGTAFISGMHAAMLAGAIISLVGVAASFLVKNNTPDDVQKNGQIRIS